jgi:hypothetical protein
MARKIIPATERFLSKVEPEPNSGCLLWAAGYGDVGYGSFCLWLDGRWQTIGSHRAAWILFVGPIPAGSCVLHTCNVRACVRLDHLYLGTKMQNAHDFARVGRGRVSRRGLPYGVDRSGSISKPFRARVRYKGEHIHLGMFHSAVQAAAAAHDFKATNYGGPAEERKT